MIMKEIQLTEQTLKELVWAIQKARALKIKGPEYRIVSDKDDTVFVINTKEAKSLDYHLESETPNPLPKHLREGKTKSNKKEVDTPRPDVEPAPQPKRGITPPEEVVSKKKRRGDDLYS